MIDLAFDFYVMSLSNHIISWKVRGCHPALSSRVSLKPFIIMTILILDSGATA
jgi:hypothetical protein